MLIVALLQIKNLIQFLNKNCIQFLYKNCCRCIFLPHCFIKRKQSEQYELDKVQAQKENSHVMVSKMDYAENYTCRAQDEVQSAHWNQT